MVDDEPSLVQSVYEHVRYNFHEVVPGKFYRSAQLPPDALKWYANKYGIKTVINLRGERPDQNWWQGEKQATEECGLVWINIMMSTSCLPSKENLLKLLDAYAHAPRPILVHCRMGADRTGEACALWLLDQENKPKEEALEQLAAYYFHFSCFDCVYAKRLFIKMWQGRDWAKNEYDPDLYPNYAPDGITGVW